MRKFPVILLVFTAFLAERWDPCMAQNLIDNYSFEVVTMCPVAFGNNGPTVAPPWIGPTLGSPDIFNSCAGVGPMLVPTNFFGNEPALSGNGYAGIYTKFPSYEYREYLSAPLSTPLLAGEWYYVEFYVSLADNVYCGIEHIGAYFSASPPTIQTVGALDLVPQVVSNQGFLSDQQHWTLISGCFQAEGGEGFITIGNFQHDGDNPVDPACQIDISYYYLENVTVMQSSEPDELVFDLGDPVYACYAYEIDPGIPDLIYIWEDGSHGTTLDVFESGVYSLTLTDGCRTGVDSIEVNIQGLNDPVSFDEDMMKLCEGDVFSPDFDPDIGNYLWSDGGIGADHEITTSGLYTVTLDDGCALSMDEIQLIFEEPIEPFSFGPDGFLCFEDEYLFSFDPALGQFLWQDGTTSSDYTIQDPGEYSLTISNACGDVSDAIEFTDLDIPEIYIGPDTQYICSGNLIDIEIDPSLGEILWQDGNNAFDYTISAGGTYAVFVTNQCGTGSAQIEVVETDSPLFFFGPDQILCAGNTLLLSPGNIDGNFFWQDGSSNPSFTVTSSGVYALTISNACGEWDDEIYVEFIPPVTVPDLGADFSLCPGEQFTLSVTDPTAQFLWQDMSTGETFTVTGPGTYYVQASNSCSSASDTIVVSLNNAPPDVDLPSNLTLCQGVAIDIESGIGGVNYLWSNGSTDPKITVTTPGNYVLTVSNACGMDVDSTQITDGGPAPSVDLGPDVSICPGETISLVPVFSDVSTWSWSTGETTPVILINTSGTIDVQASNACGTTYDTIRITPLPATPQLSLGPDTSFCPGDQITLSVLLPGVSIAWSDGSSGSAIIISTPGMYGATITDACGTSSDDLVVSTQPPPPVLNLGNDKSLCPGESILIDPTLSGVDYLWQDGSINSTYTATQAGDIILTVSNACGMASDTLVITESTDGPQVHLGSDILACEGDLVLLTADISGVNYLWQDGSTGPTFLATQSGTYFLQVSNLCGDDADTVKVDIHGVPPLIDLGPDTVLCTGQNIKFTLQDDGETFFTWQDGTGQPFYTVTSAGVYSVSAVNRCGENTDTLKVMTIDPPLPFSIGEDTTLCPGESILLSAPLTNDLLMWQDGSDGATLLADQEQKYSLEISNDCGTERDEFTLSFDHHMPDLAFDPAVVLCPGEEIVLDAGQSFPANYTWNTGETTSAIRADLPGDYAVTVTTPCVEAAASTILLQGSDCDTLSAYFIPNVFSPNGDQVNDLFTIAFTDRADILALRGYIYDRWGTLVFSSGEIPFVWDGQFNGHVLNPGVYVYSIIIDWGPAASGHREMVTGDVTLMR